MCHMSRSTYQVSCVTVTYSNFVFYTLVKLFGEGSVINGATTTILNTFTKVYNNFECSYINEHIYSLVYCVMNFGIFIPTY